jgi:hypothetical protein
MRLFNFNSNFNLNLNSALFLLLLLFLPRHNVSPHGCLLWGKSLGRKIEGLKANLRRCANSESGLGFNGDPVSTYLTTTRGQVLTVSPPGPSQYGIGGNEP